MDLWGLILVLAQSVIEGKGWENHEDTFEEALRRELLQARKENELLKDDLKQLTESYYKAIGKKYESKE